MSQKKFDILYRLFAKPVTEMYEMYKNSAVTIDNGIVDSKVLKHFSALEESLKKQLDKERKK